MDGPRLWNLLPLDESQVVVLEVPRSAEELVFGLRHRLMVRQFQFDELERRDHVRQLKEFVSFRRDGLSELDLQAGTRPECRDQQVCDGCLSTVIVDFDSVKFGASCRQSVKEAREVSAQAFDKLFFAADEPLVHDKAMVAEIKLVRERQHPAKDLATERPVHYCECVLLANQRPCVEADVRQAHFKIVAIKFINEAINRNALVVEDKGDDVIRGIRVRELKAPGLVHEYAQCRLCHENQKWRESLPVTLGEELAPLLEHPDPAVKMAVLYHILFPECNGLSYKMGSHPCQNRNSQ